jgi:hypothetical protein
MSKQELTKWKNKFKLWLILHNENATGYGYSHRCTGCKTSSNKIECNNIKTLIYDSRGDVVYFSVNRINIMTDYCIEWIKYV